MDLTVPAACTLCTFIFPLVSRPNFAGQIQKIMASAITAVRRSVDPLRLQALKRLQCSIFSTTYNPTNARNGAKYLKGRLRGPSLVQYYPPRITFKDIEHILHGEFGVTDLAEQERLDDVEERKRRGKGAPKKAKTKGARLFSSVFLSLNEAYMLIALCRGQQTCGEEKTIDNFCPSRSIFALLLSLWQAAQATLMFAALHTCARPYWSRSDMQCAVFVPTRECHA